jgi:hypothetical protein
MKFRGSLYICPLSRHTGSYKTLPRALFLLELMDCGLSLLLRLGIPYPDNPETSFSVLVFNPYQVSGPPFRAIPDKSAPPPLMLLATALSANNFPLASRPDIRTARSAGVRSSRRRSTMTVILQQTGLISWGGAGDSALVGRGIHPRTSRHASECSRFPFDVNTYFAIP